ASADLPITGMMSFDTDDLDDMLAEGILDEVVLHEMGHVLGIGTLWDWVGLLNDANRDDPFFTGTNARQGFNNVGGTAYVGNKVPVEGEYAGPGTACAHWRESVFDNELMTGFIGSGANPLSQVSVRSLIDLGYSVSVGES